MKEELKNLIIRLEVSNTKVENLMDNFNAVKRLYKQYEKYLIEELEICSSLANKVELELLMEDAGKAQMKLSK